MSQENVEVVRKAVAALDRRDVEAYLAVASQPLGVLLILQRRTARR
jgi:hypothetical protein